MDAIDILTIWLVGGFVIGFMAVCGLALMAAIYNIIR